VALIDNRSFRNRERKCISPLLSPIVYNHAATKANKEFTSMYDFLFSYSRSFFLFGIFSRKATSHFRRYNPPSQFRRIALSITMLVLLLLPLSSSDRPQVQALAAITLPAPNRASGLPLGQALSLRHSERSFKSTPIPNQELSDILWAAGGINRPSTGLLTTPTAIDALDISIYVVLPAGIYVYDRKANVLNGVAEGDHRNSVAGVQPTIATASAILLLVSDYSKFTGQDVTEQKRLSALDTGIVAQSVLLWAAANGYVACPRALMETDTLVSLLKLKSTQILHLNVPIGLAP
jgi:nitroreductase